METTKKDTTYNGWANYETWNVKLWMDNDEGSYKHWQSEARRATEAYKLAQTIKSEYEASMPDLGSTVWADLLNGALSEVNWMEIAQALMDEQV